MQLVVSIVFCYRAVEVLSSPLGTEENYIRVGVKWRTRLDVV